MRDIKFILEETESKGRWIAHISEYSETAELTFSKSSSSLVIVDHTGVPETLSGQGLGLALSEQMVTHARDRGYQIVPLCPFFKAMAARHPDWADVVQ